MSKLTFRAKALDAHKPMPIYFQDECPDLADYAAMARSVPKMPSGMEKEEESEHHLLKAMSSQLDPGINTCIIPIPETQKVASHYESIYGSKVVKLSRQYIHVQPMGLDQEVADYDMDSEDESWLTSRHLDVDPDKFEMMMDRLEKGSGQTVVSLKDAKALLREDDDLVTGVYDYWLNKRLKYQQALIPVVKQEKCGNTTVVCPYVAFRRRTEKMQTRKIRKNDEASYEKMLRLKRDLERATSLMDLVRKREKQKKELLHLSIEIYEKRYQANDLSGDILRELETVLRRDKPVLSVPVTSQYSQRSAYDADDVVPQQRKRRKYTRATRNHFNQNARNEQTSTAVYDFTDLNELPHFSDTELSSMDLSESEKSDSENISDGPFAFKRLKGAIYYAARDMPVSPPLELHHRFAPSSSIGNKFLGYTRRRIGRGGRVVLDRDVTDIDKWRRLALENSFANPGRPTLIQDDHAFLLHFQPTLVSSDEEEDDPPKLPPVPKAVQRVPRGLKRTGSTPLLDHGYSADSGVKVYVKEEVVEPVPVDSNWNDCIVPPFRNQPIWVQPIMPNDPVEDDDVADEDGEPESDGTVLCEVADEEEESPPPPPSVVYVGASVNGDAVCPSSTVPTKGSVTKSAVTKSAVTNSSIEERVEAIKNHRLVFMTKGVNGIV